MGSVSYMAALKSRTRPHGLRFELLVVQDEGGWIDTLSSGHPSPL